MSDISNHFLMNLRSHLDLILFSLITLTFVKTLSISGSSTSILIRLSSQLLREFLEVGCEPNVPVVSFTQTTRSGFGKWPDVGAFTDISESFGLLHADLMLPLFQLKRLEELGQILVKQLKNRYNDLIHKALVVGIDRANGVSRTRTVTQDDLLNSSSDPESSGEQSKPKKSFEGFKF